MNKPSINVSLLAAAIASVAFSAQAATQVDLHRENVGLINAQYRAASKNLGMPGTPHLKHAEMLGLDPNSSLKQLAVVRDDDGDVHYRYQQLFRGVPVYGKHVVVSESKGGDLRSLFGRMIGDIGEDVHSITPKISSAQALSTAKRVAFGNSVMSMRVERETVRKMIYVDGKGRAKLSYVIEMYSDGGKVGKPTRPYVIVDANSGRILKHWEGLTTAEIGTGPGGNVKTGQYEWGSGGIYGFLDVAQSGATCTMNNADVKSVNLNGGTSGSTAFSYACPRNTFKTINGAYSPINDAHFFGGVIQHMYNTYTGANALTFQLVMRVHYRTNYENANWDGQYMNFGDGASTFYPLVSADVAGHEVSHGYTEQHSGLEYFGQSGGLNESYSDIGGEATEYFWKGTNDFKVGDEIFKAPGQALRYMEHPSDDGISIDSADDFTGNLDPHYSSGPPNRAFYLLAHTAGWDTPKAFKVFAKANGLYWTPDTNYYEAACALETAADDLGYTVADVTAALAGVDIACGGGVKDGGVLTKGVAKTGQSVSAPKELMYTIAVPSGATNLTVTLSGGTGDGDLYLSNGFPEYGNYDCRSLSDGNTESCVIAAPAGGTYYVNVKPYLPVSGLSVKADYTGGTDPTGDTDGGALVNGTTITGITKTDGSVTYRLVVPARSTKLLFTASGGTGNADMYVKRGNAPTDVDYDCRPLKSGNAEACGWNVPKPGTYYIKLKANPSFDGVSLKGQFLAH
jgi:pseudolysin/vibriolysin